MKIDNFTLYLLVNGDSHVFLGKNKTLMSLGSALFPGINYFSLTGFGQVMRQLVIPILKKRYSKLTLPRGKKMTRVAVALPCKGYEWQYSAKWKAKFKKLLAS